MSDELNFIAFGFFDDGLNSQSTWQGSYFAEEDTRGRGYPDWLPDNTTTLAPLSVNSRFVNGAWVG